MSELDMQRLPDGVGVSLVLFHSVRIAVFTWIARAEVDADFLALLVDVSAYSRNPLTSMPSQESKVLLKEFGVDFPVRAAVLAILRNCLVVRKDHKGFTWRVC